MDINIPINNIELVEQLKKLKENYSESVEHRFFEMLLLAKFLSPLSRNSLQMYNSDKDVLLQNASIELIQLEDKFGNNYLPVFTDFEEIKKWNDSEEIRSLVLSFDDYKALIYRDDLEINGFVLNPFGENIVFDKKLIQQVENSLVKVKKDESVMIGLPEKYQEKMLEELSNFFSNVKSVKSAFLLFMVRGGIEKSYLMIVDVESNENKIFKQIGEFASKYLNEDEVLDIAPLSSYFGKNAVKGYEPFYRKQENII